MGRLRAVSLLALLVTAAAMACTGDDEGLEGPDLVGRAGGEDEGPADPGRSGEACAEYSDALCDYVERCRPSVKREECDALARSIVCLTDGRAEGCTLGIDGASCGSPPGDCELSDVADPEPARVACEAMVEATCRAQGGCALSEVECAAAREALACDTVIGVKAGLERCLDDLADPSCDELPVASCQGLFVGSQ
jgi:hypothetical protein